MKWKKGRMFAAAKKGNSNWRRRSYRDCFLFEKKVEKFFLKKKKQKYCVVKKRVLYLHPLSKETSWGKRKEVHRHIELTA